MESRVPLLLSSRSATVVRLGEQGLCHKMEEVLRFAPARSLKYKTMRRRRRRRRRREGGEGGKEEEKGRERSFPQRAMRRSTIREAVGCEVPP